MSEDLLGDNPETLNRLHGLLDDEPEKVFQRISQVESLQDYDSKISIGILGLLIDSAGIIGNTEGLKKAIELAKNLLDQDLKQGHTSRIHYDLGNAYSHLRKISSRPNDRWSWEKENLEEEIVHFRKALASDEVEGLTEQEVCKIDTNLGNNFSETGRFIEAINSWNRALETDPEFNQAKGQKGRGLFHYAFIHYDPGHFECLLRAAYYQLTSALEGDNLFPKMKKQFESYRDRIEELLEPDKLEEQIFDEYSLGDTKEEREYRKWCLDKTLFLNSLNDIGPYSIGARDILHLGSVSSANSNRIVSSVGFFNQLKQEYISARYLLYEGTHKRETHFCDKKVNLENTRDYPAYSFSTEKVKMSFRMAYSLFDKIATFLQYYFDLSYIKDPGPHFDQVWYKSKGKSKLAPEFEGRKNWPLLGLFWLSKDLEYHSDMYVEKSLDPGAKKLRVLRNDLEHGYVKLHDDLWTGPDGDGSIRDELARSLYRSSFQEKAIEIMQKARAALIYLALAIYKEERRKKQDRDNPDVPFRLGRWEDEWKR